MLNTFPDLLSFGLLAPTIIRLCVGFVLIYFSLLTLSKLNKKVAQKLDEYKYPAPKFMTFLIGIVGVVSGSFIIAGFFTQVSALVTIYLLLNLSIIDSGDSKIFGQSTIFYIILILITTTLLFSGAGFLAFDLPL